jgi:hypothetical protein
MSRCHRAIPVVLPQLETLSLGRLLRANEGCGKAPIPPSSMADAVAALNLDFGGSRALRGEEGSPVAAKGGLAISNSRDEADDRLFERRDDEDGERTTAFFSPKGLEAADTVLE